MTTVGRHIDTAKPLELRQSPAPFALLAAFFGLLTLLFLAVIVVMWGDANQFRRFADWLMLAGVVIFGFFTFLMLRRAAMGNAAVVWISPEGFSNWICTPIIIPWSGMTGISMHTGRGAHLRMTLNEETARRFRPNWLHYNLQRLNTLQLRPALLTSPVGLQISLQDLFNVTRAYAKAYGGPTA